MTVPIHGTPSAQDAPSPPLGSHSLITDADRPRLLQPGRPAVSRRGRGTGRDPVSKEEQRWESMNQEQFGRLRRPPRLQDRNGRVWTVHAEPFQHGGVAQIIARAGDMVRRVPEGFADDYMLLQGYEGARDVPLDR
jgi:hypothetical protein